MINHMLTAHPVTALQVINLDALHMPRSELLQLAKRSRAYVEHWHDPVIIAKRIKADLEKAMVEVNK